MKEKIKLLPIIGPIAKIAGDTLRYLNDRAKRRLLYKQHHKILRQNLKLKDKFKGKKAFILGCGPSINDQNLSSLSNEFCISVSNFFVHKDFKTIKPYYHVFAESHDPITERQMAKWLQDAEKHFLDGQKVVMSVTDKFILRDSEIFSKQDVSYYLINQNIPLLPHRKINFSEQIPQIRTVVHIAIYLAIYSGATEIYLLGVDHDWLSQGWTNRHFYQEEKNVLWSKQPMKKNETDIESECLNYLGLWAVYKRIRAYSEYCGIRVFNITPKSLLDVFPRSSLEKILHE